MSDLLHWKTHPLMCFVLVHRADGAPYYPRLSVPQDRARFLSVRDMLAAVSRPPGPSAGVPLSEVPDHPGVLSTPEAAQEKLFVLLG